MVNFSYKNTLKCLIFLRVSTILSLGCDFNKSVLLSFTKEYLELRLFPAVSILAYPEEIQNGWNRVGRNMFKYLSKDSEYRRYINFVPPDFNENEKVTPTIEENDNSTLRTSSILHITSSTALYIIAAYNHPHVDYLKKTLEQENENFYPFLLIFICQSVMDIAKTLLPLKLNNQIVFAVVPEDAIEISLMDYFQINQETELQSKLIGVWTSNMNRKERPKDQNGSFKTRESGIEKVLNPEDFNIMKYRRNWTGFFIRCLYIPVTGNVEVKEGPGVKTEFSGRFAYAWNILHESLNFSYECKRMDGYGSFDEKTQSWTGMVKALMNDEADVAISPLDVIYSRSQVIDFLHPSNYQNKHLCFMKIGSDSSSWKRFVKEFSSSVWLVIGITAMIFIIIFVVITNLNPVERNYSVSDGFITLTSSMSNMGSNVELRSLSGRTFILTLLLTCYMLYAHYTSSLISHLTVENYKPPFTTLEGLANSDYRFTVETSTSYKLIFQSSRIPSYQKIWKEKMEPYLHEFPANMDGLRKLIETGKYATIASYPSALMGNRTCEIYKVPINMKLVQAWGVQKNSQLKPMFNRIIQEFYETGIYKRNLIAINIRREYEEALVCSALETNRAIRLQNINFLLNLMAFGVGLAITLLIAEVMYSKYFMV